MIMSIPLTAQDSLVRLQHILLRLGLVCSALLLWHATGSLRSGELPGVALPVWGQLGLYGFGFALVMLAAVPAPPRWAGALILCALLAVLASELAEDVMNEYRTGVWTVDVYLYAEYALHLFKNGANPYTYDMYATYRVLLSPTELTTFMLTDDIAAGLPYGSLAFLVLLPFDLLGLPTQHTYIAFLALVMIVIFAQSSAVLRPVILLPLVVIPLYIDQQNIGINDIVWMFFCLMMIAQWRRGRLRAVWFGLACAYKIQPWLLFPFIVIHLWTEQPNLKQRFAAVAGFVGISLGVAALFNLPFILPDTAVWFTSFSEPIRDGQIITGTGLSRLTETGIVLLPKSAYTLLMGVVYAALIGCYALIARKAQDLLWVLPGFLFFFSFRGFDHYWIYGVIPLVLAIGRSAVLPAMPPTPAPRPGLLAGLLLVVGLLTGSVIGWYALQPNPLSIAVEGRLEAVGDEIGRLTVVVGNDSDRLLTPRFSLQGRQHQQPAFWHIIDGPPTLAPGESGTFRLQGADPAPSFRLREGVQVIVSDAFGYDLRASTYIPGDVAPAHPGAIPNGDFRFWRQGDDTPSYWDIFTNTADSAAPVVEYAPEGERRLRLRLPAAEGESWASVRLGTQVMFTESSIRLWVKPPAGANLPPAFDLAYGLELAANGRRVWVLFGDEAAQGEIEPGLYYVIQPAPRAVWSVQQVDPYRIFADLGFPILDLEMQPVRRFETYNFPKTALDVGLLLAARRQPAGVVEAEFGAVASTTFAADRTARTRQEIDHPERTLLWRGEQALRARTYASARSHFERVLAINPDEARAMIGLARVQLAEGDFEAALVSLDRGRGQMDAQPDHYTLFTRADQIGATGAVYLAQGRCFEAAITYEQARVLLPTYPLPLDALAACGGGLLASP